MIESSKKLVTEDAVYFGKQKIFTETQKIPVLKDGKTTKVITIIKNIARHKQMEEALSKTNEELERRGEERKRISRELHD